MLKLRVTKMIRHITCATNLLFPTLITLLFLLSGCSGGETGTGGLENPIPAESTTSVGRITSLDGVVVNGVSYNIDDSTFTLNEMTATETDLEVGMVVVVQGTINEDGVSGVATHIEYRDIIEGFVLDNKIDVDGLGTLNILNQIVIVDELTVFKSDVDDSYTVQQIEDGNVIEVSGFTSGNGTIYATRLRVKKALWEIGDEVELKGVISVLTATTFNIGSLKIDFNGAQQTGFSSEGMSNGQLVQATSTDGLGTQGELIASAIKIQGDGTTGLQLTDGEKIVLEGIVTTLVTPAEEFILNGQLINITGDTLVLNGSAAEIIESRFLILEGRVDINGIVIADKINFLGQVDISMQAFVESIDLSKNTLVVLGSTIFVDNYTIMRDKRNNNQFVAVREFSLKDLQVGEMVKINITEIASLDFVASDLQRKDIKNMEVRLAGKVDEINTNQIMIAGIKVDTSMAMFKGKMPGTVLQLGGKVKVKGIYDIFSTIFLATEVRKIK